MKEKIPEDEREELADCFAANAAELFGYARWITRGDRQLAEDLVQDAFHEAAARWQDLRVWNQERQACWLRGTMHNLAVTNFRRAALDRSKREMMWQRYRPPRSDTHEQALTAIALAQCWKVIEQMPDRRHLAALMRWGLNMSISEIADALGIAEGTVSAHLASARKELVAAAGPHVPFDLGGKEGRRS